MNTARAEPEKPAKKPHVQEFVQASQQQWAWVAMDNKYRDTIGKLEKQVRELQFESSLQVAVDEGEKKRLAKENEALRAQIQKMKVAAKNPARSNGDEKLITNLRQKVSDYSFDLNKAESELAKARKQLAKNAEERVRLVKQLRERYDYEVAGLKKRVISTENKIIKQAKDFKVEREHCYTTLAQLEIDLQQLQEQNHVAEQTSEDKAQQIGPVMTFVKQIMSDLDRLQRELAYRPAARLNNVPQAPRALMYS
ncbi:uncharacterized protein [Nicotiana sylvestris]|uniref:uncharacterized protein n=1 Tax=Nicotiana sylvestris TaxID=4096 RepID=UPI00388C33F4